MTDELGIEMLKPVREKYWSELTDLEKIGRLREMVKGLIGEVAFLRSRLGTLEDHVHVGEHLYTKRQGYGKVQEDSGRRSRKDDEVLF